MTSVLLFTLMFTGMLSFTQTFKLKATANLFNLDITKLNPVYWN